MAVKKTIELDVDIKKAQDDIRDIREQFTDLKKSIDSVEDSAKKTAKNTEKGFKGLKGAVDRVKKGFSGLGLAIKGLGIGLVLEAFNTFKSVLQQNQVVSDAFAVAFGTVSNLFNDFINFVLNNWQKATKPITEFFESDTFNTVNDIFFEIVTRIKNIIEGIGGLGKALVKVFQRDFQGAADEAKNAITNFGDAIKGNAEETISVQETVANTLKKVGDVIKENTKDAYENAKAEVALRNAAALAAAEQEKLRIANLKAAEDQRKIRDNISLTIEERIAANEKLGIILEEGIKQEKELAAVQLAAAEAALANNSTNIELQAEVIRAQAAELEIAERIGGIQAEQETNRIALLKEKLDLTNAISQSDSEARLRELEGQALLEDGILDRLELERQVAAEQKRIAEEQFENTSKLFKKGTIEYKNALEEQKAAQETYSNINESIKKKEEEAKLQIVSEGLNGLQQLLGESSVAGKAVAIAQSIINTYQGATKALAQGGIFGAIGAAGVIASGLATVKKIVATKIPGTSDTAGAEGISAPGQPITSQAPAFNVVGQSPINQLAQTIGGQQPVKAYVVSSDVTTAQQLDRNIISESGI